LLGLGCPKQAFAKIATPRYWSTPKEILSKGAGDCEDHSIAKYFTLKKLGIAEHKIRLTYVKSLNRNQPHMVVTYYTSPDAIPFILDNLNQTIKPASKRNDLLPIYSFNDSGFWLEKFKGNGKKLGDSNQLSMWTNLRRRMKGIS
jgi:predicted transglutaminase-like cysteine proteinase